jgi:DNA replicative helicase MCM subunit Mcm2 (Cdc46/Mcm family)
MDPNDFEILKFIKYHLEKKTSIQENIKNSLRYSTQILNPYSQDWITSLEEYKKLVPLFEERMLRYLTEFEKMNIYPKYYLRFHNLEDNILFYIETYYYCKFKKRLERK